MGEKEGDGGPSEGDASEEGMAPEGESDEGPVEEGGEEDEAAGRQLQEGPRQGRRQQPEDLLRVGGGVGRKVGGANRMLACGATGRFDESYGGRLVVQKYPARAP